MARTRAGRRLVALAAALVVLAGCELEVTAELGLERDGSGTAGVSFALDPELVAELDTARIDPTAELAAAVVDADGWELDRSAGDDDGLRVTATFAGDDPSMLTDALAELSAGLGPDDPALEVDLDLAVDVDGAARLEGEAWLRAPAGPGVVDDPDLPDPEEMAALTSEHVTATLAVTLPARPAVHDADRVDGRTLRWDVPVDTTVPIRAHAPAPSRWTPTLVVVAAGAVGLLVAGAAVGWAWRRRGA